MEHSILRFVYSVQMPKRTATINPALRKLIVELHLKNNSYGKIAEHSVKASHTYNRLLSGGKKVEVRWLDVKAVGPFLLRSEMKIVLRGY